MSTTDTAATALVAGQLEAFAANLTGRGFATTIVTGRRHLCVRVVNRATPQLREEIYAASAGDDSWWFWWSWADKIAPIDAVEDAATAISYVLAPDGR